MLRKLSDREKKKIKTAFTEEAATTLRKKTKWSISLVSHYKNATKTVSAERAIIIESLIGIPAAILRPDIFRR